MVKTRLMSKTNRLTCCFKKKIAAAVANEVNSSYLPSNKSILVRQQTVFVHFHFMSFLKKNRGCLDLICEPKPHFGAHFHTQNVFDQENGLCLRTFVKFIHCSKLFYTFCTTCLVVSRYFGKKYHRNTSKFGDVFQCKLNF